MMAQKYNKRTTPRNPELTILKLPDGSLQSYPKNFSPWGVFPPRTYFS